MRLPLYCDDRCFGPEGQTDFHFEHTQYRMKLTRQIIDLYFRKGTDIYDCARIMNLDVEDIRFLIDCAKQNRR